MIVLYLLMYHRRTAEESARLSGKLEQALEEKEKEEVVIMRTMAQVLKEEGEKIGIEKGEKIGEVRGIRRVVGDLLRQRFGDLPERVENRLLAMDAVALESLALAVHSARSLDDLGL